MAICLNAIEELEQLSDEETLVKLARVLNADG
jgi:hypothetical protein